MTIHQWEQKEQLWGKWVEIGIWRNIRLGMDKEKITLSCQNKDSFLTDWEAVNPNI